MFAENFVYFCILTAYMKIYLSIIRTIIIYVNKRSFNAGKLDNQITRN